MTEAYPLQWPIGWKRTEYPTYSQFKNPTVASARNLTLHELDRLGATEVVISSNMELNRDGFPSARQRRMNDTGVAVYFKMNGEERCIPSDKYFTVEENLHAVGRTIEALRALERWGTGQIMEAAFRGFTALPEFASTSSKRAWYEVLEVSQTASPEMIRAAYKVMALKTHPDHGGTVEAFQEVQDALKESGI
jgi:DnaJ-domain-containing protein 1